MTVGIANSFKNKNLGKSLKNQELAKFLKINNLAIPNGMLGNGKREEKLLSLLSSNRQFLNSLGAAN